MKTKLVAIAKDEAAYLPEWIFHHLHFGFDEIEIYINFTTDNSLALLNKIKRNHPIKFKNVEYLLEPECDKYDGLISQRYLEYNKFQSRAYAELLFNARKDGFSHVMFLDIDELWTPSCFKAKIEEVLTDLGDPDIAYFRWKNKVLENEEFGRPFQQDTLVVGPNHGKCIVKTNIEIELISSHGVSYLGQEKLKKADLRKRNIAFVLHRFQRSLIEYISLLGRGDPTFAGKPGLKFNRGGYIDASDGLPIDFDPALITSYDAGYEAFIRENKISECILEAKKFVRSRHQSVLNYAKENQAYDRKVQRLFRGTNAI